MDASQVGIGDRAAPTTANMHSMASGSGVRTRGERGALLDQIRRRQLSIEAVFDRARTDLVVAKTDARQLVEAFLWHADTTVVVGVLTRAGIIAGRRIGGLAGWQRAVLIDALG